MNNIKNNKIHRITDKLLSLQISKKFILLYLVLIMFSIPISSSVFQTINSNILANNVGNVSIQNLNTISNGIEVLLNNINSYSKFILSNQSIQTILREKQEYPSTDVSDTMRISLTLYMDAINSISSIYLFDNYNNIYLIDKEHRKLTTSDVSKASWYDEVISKKGRFILKMNGGDLFVHQKGDEFLSFIRVINDLQSNRRIGVLLINIDLKKIREIYGESINSKMDIAILNGNQVIMNFKRSMLKLSDVNLNTSISLHKIKGEEYLVSVLRTDARNWKYVSIIPFSDMTKEYNQYNFIVFLVILINGVLLFGGTLFISKMITNPIKKLIESMKMVEKGEFHTVDIKTGNDEIGKLRDVYNVMVREIEKLIERVITEQRFKRKAELNILQEQIKPHFLYNSLDAIAYMAISGQGQEAYNVIIALSNYYRTCLSKGSEVITLAKEIDIVKNYLTIQKVRYSNLITDIYEIDESVLQTKILKLILQPLVENALYHGLRPMGEMGEILVSAKKEGHFIKLVVKDNGVGISGDKLKMIISGELEINSESFGLRGTIERLKIFYNKEDIYSIRSEIGKGTEICIYIPIAEEV